MNTVGKRLLFDYGDLLVRVEYVSDRNLKWEQVKGPSPGLKGEESYQAIEIRPNVYLVFWQEKDRSVIVQVVDREKEKVYTTWISPENKLHYFRGEIHEP